MRDELTGYVRAHHRGRRIKPTTTLKGLTHRLACLESHHKVASQRFLAGSEACTTSSKMTCASGGLQPRWSGAEHRYQRCAFSVELEHLPSSGTNFAERASNRRPELRAASTAAVEQRGLHPRPKRDRALSGFDHHKALPPTVRCFHSRPPRRLAHVSASFPPSRSRSPSLAGSGRQNLSRREWLARQERAPRRPGAREGLGHKTGRLAARASGLFRSAYQKAVLRPSTTT